MNLLQFWLKSLERLQYSQRAEVDTEDISFEPQLTTLNPHRWGRQRSGLCSTHFSTLSEQTTWCAGSKVGNVPWFTERKRFYPGWVSKIHRGDRLLLSQILSPISSRSRTESTPVLSLPYLDLQFPFAFSLLLLCLLGKSKDDVSHSI